MPRETVQMPPITVTCLLYNLWAGTRFVHVIRWCKTLLPKSVARGIQEHRIQECVWTVLLAVEGEVEGVATAAIDSSKFFDIIVLDVVVTMMEDGSPRPSAEPPSQLRLHLKRFFRQ